MKGYDEYLGVLHWCCGMGVLTSVLVFERPDLLAISGLAFLLTSHTLIMLVF